MKQIFLFLAIGFWASCSNSTPNKEDEVKHIDSKRSSNHFTFTYKVELEDSSVAEGPIELWLPLPQTDGFQTVEAVEINTKAAYNIIEDSVYGNKILHVKPTNFEESKVELVVTASRFERNGPAKTEALPKEYFLKENTKVIIPEDLKKQTMALVANYPTVKGKAKAIYNEVVNTLVYDKTGKGWGAGDVLFVCDEKRGNCTDFHSLFIAMCRSVEIPAKFVIGFPLPENTPEAEVKGYHCWAEFYDEKEGWLPVDASEAFKHPEKKTYLFGNLDFNRLQFTTGRDIILKKNLSLNFFIYPYGEVNGEEANLKKSFKYSKIQSFSDSNF